MLKGPAALGVHLGVEVRVACVQQLLRPEAVKPQQPVRLIQPVLPQQGRLGVPGRQQGVLHHRHIGGVEHPFEPVAVIQPLGQPQDVVVRVRRGPHDQLGALAGGGELGGVAVLHQLLPALLAPHPDLPHGGQDGLLCLVRCQGPEARLRRQLDVDAEPVRQEPQLLHQLRRGAGDGLGVDIAVEAVLLPQDPQGPDHQLRGVVRGAVHAGGEEQSLDIIPAVELDGEIRQLLRGEHGPLRFVAAAVDAVFAVIHAPVGQQHLQKGDASAVGGEGVAAPGNGGCGVADVSRPGLPVPAAGGAGRVVLGRVRQDGELFQNVHLTGGRPAAGCDAGPGARWRR